MKTTLLTLVITLAAALGFANRSAAATISFQISNQQAESLGQVTVSTAGGNYYVNVPGNSTDSVSISDTATSVTINGQTVPQGQKAIIQLPSGKAVEVLWTSPNSITVINEDVPA